MDCINETVHQHGGRGLAPDQDLSKTDGHTVMVQLVFSENKVKSVCYKL